MVLIQYHNPCIPNQPIHTCFFLVRPSVYPLKGNQIKCTFKTGHSTISNSSLHFHFALSSLPPSLHSSFLPSYISLFPSSFLPFFLASSLPPFFPPLPSSLPLCLSSFLSFSFRKCGKKPTIQKCGKKVIFREKRTRGCGPGTVMRYTCLLTAFRVAGASACSQVCVLRMPWECPSYHLQHPMGLLLRLEKLFGSSGAWCSTTLCLSRILKGPPARSWCPYGPSSPSSSWPATQPTWPLSWSRRSLWTKWLASVTKR